jgi:AcrR family transcriptional regulator
MNMSRGSTTRTYDNRRREEQAAATRNRIVDAAAELVAESGSLDIVMADVATRAGVSLPTVFRHIPSKGDLFGALAGRAFRHVTEGLAPSSPEELAAGVAQVYERSAEQEPLVRWLLASPLAATTPRPHRTERLGMIRTALGVAAGADEDAQHVERIALLLSSPMAWLYWSDYLGLSAREAAETAGWAICHLAGGRSSEA